MGTVRHPYGVSPNTLVDLRAQSMRGDTYQCSNYTRTTSFCTVLQRDRTVSFDDDAILTFHYRQCHPPLLTSREYWGIIIPPRPITNFPNQDLIKASESIARDSAEKLFREVYDHSDSCCPDQFSTVGTTVPTKLLTVGSDCSGMETHLMALTNLGISYENVFSSDIDPKVRDFINENFESQFLYDDIRHRNNRDLKKNMDLYVAGFPCQPFSIAGHQQGLDDERGKIIHHVLHHIQHNMPKTFVLENVKGFTTLKNGQYVQQTIQFLKQIRDKNSQPAYWVSHQLVDSADHGLPHRRIRWYCVGILKSAYPKSKSFIFPESISCSSLKRCC